MMKPPQQKPEDDFILAVRNSIITGERTDKRKLEKLGRELGIHDQNTVKELSEAAIFWVAQITAGRKDLTIREKYERLVEAYKTQFNLSHRTSRSTMLQQYSTPPPVAYLAGIFAGVDQKGHEYFPTPYFEPSAGNGMLTLAGDRAHFTMNEIDEVRSANLKRLGFVNRMNLDASEPFPEMFQRCFRAVVTNPPFGSLDKKWKRDGFTISALDHKMAIHALDTMADSGRAAIIIGGHTKWDDKSRIQRGKNRSFFSYLHHFYNVVDTIQMGREVFSRMGTKFLTRLILIDGRKKVPGGFPPLQDRAGEVVEDFEELFDRVMIYRQRWMSGQQAKTKRKNMTLDQRAAWMRSLLLGDQSGLEGPYRPMTEGGRNLQTLVPDSMDGEVHRALQMVRDKIKMPFAEFVRDRLGYRNTEELFQALAPEQIDAVALAIFNIEYRGQGMIDADQTGIGKGRVAAAMVRYGVRMGLRPIFLTEKPNLFSDLYRDLAAIGAGHLRPFIVNGRSARSNIKDQMGKLIWQAPSRTEQSEVFDAGEIPARYQFIMATYSQFNSPTQNSYRQRMRFLKSVAERNLIIMDESHNASGSSFTGLFFQSLLRKAAGCLFLSATYAKRPDNLSIYAAKTALSESGLSPEGLTMAIEKGGVALQEVLSAQLVEEGQLLRRERSYEGIEVNYIVLDESATAFGLEDKKQEHRTTYDLITAVMRRIIEFQREYVVPQIREMDSALARGNMEATERAGTREMGVSNSPYFSKVFMVVNQMLMSIKAEATAQLAIRRLKEGMKPVIAFSSTMESFYDELKNELGLPAQFGDTVEADFASTLQRGLDGVLRYTVVDPMGNSHKETMQPGEISAEAGEEYQSITRMIRDISSGISISPIDHIIGRIEEAGYSVAEVTGRSRRIELDLDSLTPREIINQQGELVLDGSITGVLQRREKVATGDAFRAFNDNEVDVLLINQSGSTGASAHAIPTAKVRPLEVKPRVMIVLQPELNINTEVQKRGRIHRTGQIHKPTYDYLVSAIPAEQRLLMLLQKKLKSLDANTSGNQRQSEALMLTEDFLNIYGSHVVYDYLQANRSLAELLARKSSGEPREFSKDYAQTISGRVAVLGIEEQEEFYREISERYRAKIELAKQEGTYDLEVEVMDFRARVEDRFLVAQGGEGNSVFSGDTYIEKCMVRNLKRPFSQSELQERINKEMGDQTDPDKISEQLIQEFLAHSSRQMAAERERIAKRYESWLKAIPRKRVVTSLKTENERSDMILELRRKASEDLQEEIDRAGNRRRKQEAYISSLLRYFYIGRGLWFEPPATDGIQTPVVCLGFSIDRSKPNPWTPSAMRLSFAVGNGIKYLSGNLSGDFMQRVNGFRGNSAALSGPERDSFVLRWREMTEGARMDYLTRYIITGNLLRAASMGLGRLISFSDSEGQVRKGVLVAGKVDEDKMRNSPVEIPIYQSLPYFGWISPGNQVKTSGKIVIGRVNEGMYELITASSKSSGGIFYQDEELLSLVQGENFNKVSDKMKAVFTASRLQQVLRHLDEHFSLTVTIPRDSYFHLAEAIRASSYTRPVHRLRPPDRDDARKRGDMRARALRLKLLLLSNS